MNGKEDKLLSNDRSLGLSLVATIHPFADVKGYPEFKPAKVNPALVEVTTTCPEDVQ